MLYMAYHVVAENVDDLEEFAEGTVDQLRDGNPRKENQIRAAWAAEALITFANRTGRGEEPETILADLLGDIRHLCDALGLDYGAVDSRAYNYYQQEIAGEL